MAKENTVERWYSKMESQSRRNWMENSTKKAFLDARPAKNTPVDKNDVRKAAISRGAKYDLDTLTRPDSPVETYNKISAGLFDISKNELQADIDLQLAQEQWVLEDRYLDVKAKYQLKALIEQRKKEVNAEGVVAEKQMSEQELIALIRKIQVESLTKPFKKGMDLAAAIIDRLPAPVFKIFLPITILAMIQIACGLSPTPTPDSNAVTQKPGASTSEASPAATESATAASTETAEIDNAVLDKITKDLDLPNNPHYNSVAKASEQITNQTIPEMCLPFGTDIKEKGIADIYSNTFKLSAYSTGRICYLTNGVQDIFNINDGQGYLIIDKKTGEEIAKITDGTMNYDTPSDGFLGELMDKDGNPTGVGVSAATGQWSTANQVAGEINVIPTMTAVNPAGQEAGFTSQDKLEQAAMTLVAKEAIEKNIYPSGLSEQEDAALIKEMNVQAGNQLPTFEIPNKPNSMLVYVSPDLYPNFATEFASEIETKPTDTLKASDYKEYGNFDNIFQVSKDFFTKHPEVKERLRQDKFIQVSYELDKDGNRTGNFVLNYKNEKFVIPNSGKYSDSFWGEPITAENLDKKIAAGEFTMPTKVHSDGPLNIEWSIERKAILIPAVTLPFPKTELPRIMMTSTGEVLDMAADYMGMATIHMMPDENGKLHPIAIQMAVAGDYGSGFTVFKEGSSTEIDATGGNEMFRNGAVEKGKVQLIPGEPSLFWVVVTDWPDTPENMKNYNKLIQATIKGSSTLELADASKLDLKSLLGKDKMLFVYSYQPWQELIKMNK